MNAFLICALRSADFLREGLSPRANSCIISLSTSSSFWHTSSGLSVEHYSGEDQTSTDRTGSIYRRRSSYMSILSYWRKWALGAPTNRFPLIWEKSSNGRRLKTALEKSSKYRCFAGKLSWGIEYFHFRTHLGTPLFYFCVWLRDIVDPWWLKEVWYAPDFWQNHCAVTTLAARRRNTRLEWTYLPWPASHKTGCWPTWGKPHACRVSYLPAFRVIFPFTLPDSSVRVAPRSLTCNTAMLR